MMTDESRVRLLDARVGRDHPRFDRGYYITSQNGLWYLTQQGDWTHGIDHSSTRNWWPSRRVAQKFLKQQKEEAEIIEKMEHTGMRWKVRHTAGLEAHIVTDEDWPWCVVEGCGYLPEDQDGSKTLQHICDLHNAWLMSQAGEIWG